MRLYEATHDVYQVEKALGHAKVAVTEAYLRSLEWRADELAPKQRLRCSALRANAVQLFPSPGLLDRGCIIYANHRLILVGRSGNLSISFKNQQEKTKEDVYED